MKMVREAGSPSLQKQTVKPECLQGMESGYEDILFQLGRVIKAKDFITYINTVMPFISSNTLDYCFMIILHKLLLLCIIINNL